jgi:peptidoglycan/xylan/chitin deacetylase (PgdA/CDA1 family)
MRLLPVLFCAIPLFAGRQVAITIDDLPFAHSGPGACRFETLEANTRRLLSHLKGIPVTGFLITGACPDLTPAQRKAILDQWRRAGTLGNHTHSHPGLNRVSSEEYEADILKAQALLPEARFFRSPMLQTGPDKVKKARLESFLKELHLRQAPVTFDNSDWMFAYVYALGTPEQKARARVEYVPYMESVIAFFEQRGEQVVGRDFPHVLLLHANLLNADLLPGLLEMLRRRGYGFVSLEQALKDPAYSLPNEYAGPGGFSWVHRWSKTKGMPNQGEPGEPAWLVEAYEKLRR